MVQRAKEDFRKRLDEEFLHTTDTLWANEIEANLFTAKVLIWASVMLALCLVLDLLGVFSIEKGMMARTCGFGILELVIPALICIKLKGKKKWLKVIMLLELTIVLARLQSVLNQNVTLVMLIPVVLSVRYYSRYVTVSVAIMTTLLSGVSAWASVVLKMGIIDLNFLPVTTGTELVIINNDLRETLVAQASFNLDNVWKYVLVNSYFPRFIVYSLIATVCVEIAGKGRRAIFDQKSETEKTERISTELNLASDIQANMLPNIFPAFPEHDDFDIFATMDPAKEVGGDFYDYFFVDEKHFAMVIADVSGKGIPAAMFMVIAKTLIKDHAQLGLAPGDVFTRVNKLLCEGNEAGLFVTAWMGVLDLDTGLLTYANAGHNPPVAYINGAVSFLKSKPGFVLAGFEETKYKQFELQLHKGDKLFLYTDGATEATNINGELYGEDRLINCLKQQVDMNVETTLHNVRADIDEFVGEAEQFDDLTLLAFDYSNKIKPSNAKKLVLDAKVENLDKVIGFLEKELGDHDVLMKTINAICVAVEEMYANICMYGYPGKDVPGKCEVDVWFDHENVFIVLIDDGIPFNPLNKVDPDIHAQAEDRDIGGLGIYMVKKTMDECTYTRSDKGQNIFTMRKVIKND